MPQVNWSTLLKHLNCQAGKVTGIGEYSLHFLFPGSHDFVSAGTLINGNLIKSLFFLKRQNALINTDILKNFA